MNESESEREKKGGGKKKKENKLVQDVNKSKGPDL
jgi:hypothetical protein